MASCKNNARTGDRKDGICLRLHKQNSSSSCIDITALLDSESRGFVLIQILYKSSKMRQVRDKS